MFREIAWFSERKGSSECACYVADFTLCCVVLIEAYCVLCEVQIVSAYNVDYSCISKQFNYFYGAAVDDYQ